jgi:hypothetical protein
VKDISEANSASIFRVEEQAKQETSMKMEAICTPETSADFHWTT